MGMLDSALLFCNSMAHGGTPAVLNLGTAFNPGGGNKLKGFVKCSGKDMAGTTALVVKTGTTSVTASTTVATIPMTHTQANAGFNFELPITDLKQYVTISFTGISAGTGIYAGLEPVNQTA